MDLTGIVLIALGIGLGILLFVAIAMGWMSRNDGSGAGLTAMHDFQPVDKQRATEIVIEQMAGKRWTEQESGDAARAGGVTGPEGAESTHHAEGDGEDGPRKG